MEFKTWITIFYSLSFSCMIIFFLLCTVRQYKLITVGFFLTNYILFFDDFILFSIYGKKQFVNDKLCSVVFYMHVLLSQQNKTVGLTLLTSKKHL